MPKKRQPSAEAVAAFAEQAEPVSYTLNEAGDGYTATERAMKARPSSKRLDPNAPRNAKATRFAMNEYESQLLAYAAAQEGLPEQAVLRRAIWPQLRMRFPDFTPENNPD